jgi:hypothetical protein
MIKAILIIVVAVVGAVMLYATTRPSALHVERSAKIQAPRESARISRRASTA